MSVAFDFDEHIEPITFTARELLDAAVALDHEMATHHCTVVPPTYTPHPVYDQYIAMHAQLSMNELSPIWFVRESLGDAGYDEMINLHFRVVDRVEEFLSEAARRRAYEDHFGDLVGYGELIAYSDGSARAPSPTLPDSQTFSFLDRGEALEFLSSLEVVNLASMDPADRCSICWDGYVETATEFDHTPLRLPCCGQVLGHDCVLAVVQDNRPLCPLCRQDMVIALADCQLVFSSVVSDHNLK